MDSQRAVADEHGSGAGMAEPTRPAALAFDELPRDVAKEAALMSASRDHILHRVRTALGRSAGQDPGTPPAVRLRVPEVSMDARAASFSTRLEALAGKAQRLGSMDAAREAVAAAIGGKSAVASNSPYLVECGISALPGVRTGIRDVNELR